MNVRTLEVEGSNNGLLVGIEGLEPPGLLGVNHDRLNGVLTRENEGIRLRKGHDHQV